MTSTTQTATDMMKMILDNLAAQSLPKDAEALVRAARSLLMGRCLVREDLNGALAVNLATLDFPLQVSKDGPTEEERQAYHDFVGMCREAA